MVPIKAVAMLISLLFGGAVFAQNPPPENTELNTILMNWTFEIEGQAAPGQSTLGTVFIMGRPYPGQDANANQAKKVRYVLITAAHVLEGMSGESAVLDLRRKNDDGSWVRLPYSVPTQNRRLGLRHRRNRFVSHQMSELNIWLHLATN